MKYNFPVVKYVQQNTLGQQLDHVLTEVIEIEMAVADPNTSLDEIEMEIVDLYHSLETWFRICEIQKGEEHVKRIFKLVRDKNRDRGYYKLEYAG